MIFPEVRPAELRAEKRLGYAESFLESMEGEYEPGKMRYRSPEGEIVQICYKGDNFDVLGTSDLTETTASILSSDFPATRYRLSMSLHGRGSVIHEFRELF